MHRQLFLATAAIAALSLAACNNPSQTNGAATPAEQAATPDANPVATVPTPANEAAAPDFVLKAASSDMFEVAAAKIAGARSTNAAVKTFAKTMIAAHTKSTAALKKAIATSGQSLAPPDSLTPDLQGKVDDLQKKDLKDFDKAYMDGQVDAHQSTLDVMQRYAQDGDVPAIKDFAAATAPVVQQHLDMAKKVRDGLKS